MNGIGAIIKQKMLLADGPVAIIYADEGNGDTFFKFNDDRTDKGPGGWGGLDLSTAGPPTSDILPPFGAIGTQSVALGYNVKVEGYGAFGHGEEHDVSGIWAVAMGGYGSKVGGYGALSFGTYHTAAANYGITMGHSNTDTRGGNNQMIGCGLSNTIVKVDKVTFLGHCNIEPANYVPNNLEEGIILVVGNGVLTGSGPTKFERTAPSDAFRVWKKGMLTAPDMSVSDINTWNEPKCLITKEYADATYTGGGGIPEAPNDGQQYARQSEAWAVVVGSGGGIPDAPSDGKTYGRNNAAWVEVLAGGAVDSVNGQTGVVLLDAGDINEVANRRYMTDAQEANLDNQSGVNTGDQDLSGLLGGTIADNQIAFGNGSNIAGSADLTWDGSVMEINGNTYGTAFYEGPAPLNAPPPPPPNEILNLQLQINQLQAVVDGQLVLINNLENRIVALENA